MTRAALLLCLALSGCTQFPELDAVVSASAKSAAYPRLQPLDGILAQANASTTDPAAVRGDLSARVAALRARAARMRGPIVEPPVRARMNDALRRHAGSHSG
ncbi:hypothetical protein [Oceanicola sp. 502str15]|uniref:hypothetical protein n=1 Tax=Oceanicola sp. 502str15 TaxID=2696061 RepID=UPI00209459D7|nr:hypothetical protein [Oceanicola sp. 502str15]MCO6381588.1 hypothetical protein [Oceanicola sp. 502str15]